MVMPSCVAAVRCNAKNRGQLWGQSNSSTRSTTLSVAQVFPPKTRILQEVQAIKAALAKAESAILKDHANCCVAKAIASCDAAEQRTKFS
ncbi:metal-sensing transcriptional repressor [Blastomonas sp.]|uniref:metal-sensing transcriptional repressor n=1 Tax=Blastomonas sp. TaxID=1909299 RepID=UPI003593FC4D